MVSDPLLLDPSQRCSDIYFHPIMDSHPCDAQPRLGRLLDMSSDGKQVLGLVSAQSLSTYSEAFYHHGMRVRHHGGHQWPGPARILPVSDATKKPRSPRLGRFRTSISQLLDDQDFDLPVPAADSQLKTGEARRVLLYRCNDCFHHGHCVLVRRHL